MPVTSSMVHPATCTQEMVARYSWFGRTSLRLLWPQVTPGSVTHLWD